MPNCVAHLFEPLLRRVRPGSGRHRDVDHAPAALSAGVPAMRPPCGPPPGGEVGPYPVAHQRQERARCRVSWPAVCGIDIAPRLIHGVEATA